MVAAYSINEFCAAYRMCRSTWYAAVKSGEAPPTYQVGSKTFISVEAAAKWQREREALAQGAPTSSSGSGNAHAQ